MRESVVVLEQKSRLHSKRSRHLVPVDRIGKIDVEIRDDWPSFSRHVSRGRKVRSLNVLQLAEKSLLRRTTGARIPLDRALVHHDCERKARMSLRLGHH